MLSGCIEIWWFPGGSVLTASGTPQTVRAGTHQPFVHSTAHRHVTKKSIHFCTYSKISLLEILPKV